MLVNVGKEHEDSCLAALEQVLGEQYIQVVRVEGSMEDKSSSELFGSINEAKEWTDGVFTKTFRDAAAAGKEAVVVMRCGAGATAEKFENLNTLLDDNKKLCLSSGEIIRMPSSVQLVFTAKDCSAMSPAAVSRLGMVWLCS